MPKQTTFFDRQQVDLEECILAQERGTSLERRELGRLGLFDRDDDQTDQPDPPTVILVGCVATKRDRPTRARELYTSPLFKKRRAYVEARADELGARWAILTAHPNGIFRPREVVAPYDWTLDDHVDNPQDKKGRPWRTAWAARVKVRLRSLVDLEADENGFRRPSPQTVEVHAGRAYVEALEGCLTEYDNFTNLEITHPVEGLQIGEQLAWYNERLEGLENE